MRAGTEIITSATERVILGVPAAEAVKAEAERLGARRVFILSSATLRDETGEIAAIEEALGARHIMTFSGIHPHAPLHDVAKAVRAALQSDADLIVAVGGGTVTDSGKILGLAMRHRTETPEALCALRIRYDAGGLVIDAPAEGPHIRTICVPTTLSGAEFNSLSGAYDEASGRKVGFQQLASAHVV